MLRESHRGEHVEGTRRSDALFQRALRYTPGGLHTGHRITSPPMVLTRARGSRIWDADGREFVDFHGGFSPILLGHCYPRVQAAVKEGIDRYDLFGVGTTDLEVEASALVVKHVPSVEQVLFCNCGSEATYHAVRLARAATSRKKIIKFQGAYHGWHDYLAMNALSKPERLGQLDPLSAGSLPEALASTVVLEFNNLDAVQAAVREGDVAGVILEPILHNVGCILPEPGYLAGLREICSQNGVILIFDEVITGFRHDLGGLQRLWDVTPDISTLGKAMANGYPISAIGGREELMSRFTTGGGDVYFSGTFNAHPSALAALISTIHELESEPVHDHLFKMGEHMRIGLQEVTARHGIDAVVTGFGSAFVTYFMSPPIKRYRDLLRNDADRFIAFRRGMIERGFFMMPTNLKRNVLFYEHTRAEIDEALNAADEVLGKLVRARTGSG